MKAFDPKNLTQEMTIHLNGGSEFSQLHYKILADGVDTKITRHVLTDGSPNYKKTADELHFGTDTFDMLKDKDAAGWIADRLGRTPPTDTPDTAEGDG